MLAGACIEARWKWYCTLRNSIPLAKRAPDKLLHPLARDKRDAETINFIAPSYYANGPGGTCPAVSVTAAVATFIFAASTHKPTPTEVVQLMRKTATVDRTALTSLAEFDDATVNRLETEIARLKGQGKLFANGILNLRTIYRHLALQAILPQTQLPKGKVRQSNS